MYPDMSQHQSHQGLHGNRKNSDLIKPGKSLREPLRRLKSGMCLSFTKTMFFVNFYFYGGTTFGTCFCRDLKLPNFFVSIKVASIQGIFCLVKRVSLA